MPSFNVFKALKRIQFTNNLMEFRPQNLYQNAPAYFAKGGELIKERSKNLWDSLSMGSHEFVLDRYNPNEPHFDSTTGLEPSPVLGGQGFSKILSFLSPGLRVGANGKEVPESVQLLHKLADQPYDIINDHFGIPRQQTIETLSEADIKRFEIDSTTNMQNNYVNLSKRLANQQLVERAKGLDKMQVKLGNLGRQLSGEGRLIEPEEWESLIKTGLNGDEIISESDFVGMVDEALHFKNLNDIAIPEVAEAVKFHRDFYKRMEQQLIDAGELSDIKNMPDEEMLELYKGLEIELPEDEFLRAKFFENERQKARDFSDSYVPIDHLSPEVRRRRGEWESKVSSEFKKSRRNLFTYAEEIENIKKKDFIDVIKEKQISKKVEDFYNLDKDGKPKQTAAFGKKFKPKKIDDLTKEEILKALDKDDLTSLEDAVYGFIDKGLDQEARATAERILQDPYGFFPRSGSGGKGGMRNFPSPLHRRVLNVPRNVLKEFINRDVNQYTKNYASRIIPMLHTKKVLGKSFDEALKEVDDKFDALLRATDKNDLKRQAELGVKRQSVLRDLQHIADRVQHINRSIDPDSWFSTVRSIQAKLAQMRFLTQVALASVVDVARPGMVYGFEPYGKTLKAAMTNFDKFKKSGQQLADVGIGADLILGDAMSRVDEAFTNPAGRFDQYGLGKAERFVSRLHKPFGTVSLMNIHNATMKQLSGSMVSNTFINMGKRLSSGEALESWEVLLKSRAGLSDSDLKQVYKAWSKHGEEIDGFHLPRTDLWDEADSGIRIKLENVVRKEVEEIIVSKKSSTAAIWTDNTNIGMVMNEFRTYSWNAAQMVALTGLQRHDQNFLMGAAGMIFLGGISHVAKAEINGYDIDYNNQPELLLNAIERSGVMAWVFDVNMILERATQGNVGINPLLGGAELSRYRKRDLAGVIFGPAYQQLQELGDVLGGISGYVTGQGAEPYQRSTLLRTIPYSNLTYIRGLGTALRAANEDLGE